MRAQLKSRPAIEQGQVDRLGEDFPLGSKGGVAAHHYFPVDGEYVLRLRLQRAWDSVIRGLNVPTQFELRVDGKRVVPYWARGDIDAGLASLRGKELVWIDDALDAFFVHIQGSGRISLAEGGTMRVGYAEQNGRAYRSIGRILVERGELELESVTMQSIRQWARAHPEALPSLHRQYRFSRPDRYNCFAASFSRSAMDRTLRLSHRLPIFASSMS